MSKLVKAGSSDAGDHNRQAQHLLAKLISLCNSHSSKLNGGFVISIDRSLSVHSASRKKLLETVGECGLKAAASEF